MCRVVLEYSFYIGAINKSNKNRKMKVYRPEYREDLAWTGFRGDEYYLILIDSREDDSAFKIDKMPRDDFDVHAGAYETAVMADICSDMGYAEKMLTKAFITSFIGSLKS